MYTRLHIVKVAEVEGNPISFKVIRGYQLYKKMCNFLLTFEMFTKAVTCNYPLLE